MRRLLMLLVVLAAVPCFGVTPPRGVRDPLTGSYISWSNHPQAQPYTMPLSACVTGRSVGRRWAVPEHPNCAVLFDSHICVAVDGWDAWSMQMYRFDAATLALAATAPVFNLGQLNSGTGSVEERQIPTAHRIPQIAATASNLYFICNEGSQGASSSYYLRRLATGTTTFIAPTTFSMTTGAHWVGAAVPQIGGSNAAAGYYYGCRACMTGAETERVFITGQVRTADGKTHAALMYSDDLYIKSTGQTATWTLVPLLTDGTSVITHLTTYSGAGEDGVGAMAVGVVTGIYGQDWLNVVYSEDSGATWKVCGIDEVDFAVAAGGLAYDNAEVVERQILKDADETYAVQRVIYDAANQVAWVSLVRAEGTGYLASYPTTDAVCYLLKIDMTNRATTGCTQTLYPSFSSSLRNFGNGMQVINEDANNLLVVVAMPEAATDPDTGYIDRPDGGPKLWTYRIPKATVGDGETYTRLSEASIPDGGNSYTYRDAVVQNIIHEWGYGYGQIFNGIVSVDGRADVVATLISDQRVTGSHQAYHMGRLGLVTLATGAVSTPATEAGTGQIIVPPNVGVAPSTGHRNIPFLGTQDWDSDLNFGDGAMSIVIVFSPAGSNSGGPTMPTIGGADRWGQPLVVFGEPQSQSVSSAPNANCPKDGWGLFWYSGGLSFWMLNGCSGSNDPESATYRLLRCTNLSSANACGIWTRACITKAAGATGDASFLAYANGAATTRAHNGSCNVIGDVANFAKVRWFHHVDSYTRTISVSSCAAGIWIYNRTLTATEGQNVTKAPGVAGRVDPESLSGLVARSYSGVRPWQAFGAGQRRAGGQNWIEW